MACGHILPHFRNEEEYEKKAEEYLKNAEEYAEEYVLIGLDNLTAGNPSRWDVLFYRFADFIGCIYHDLKLIENNHLWITITMYD